MILHLNHLLQLSGNNISFVCYWAPRTLGNTGVFRGSFYKLFKGLIEDDKVGYIIKYGGKLLFYIVQYRYNMGI